MTMLKQHKKTLLITSALILLPIAVGLLLWDQLPATMNIHWNAAGEADGAAGKGFAIFFVPLFLLGMHWFCALITHLTNQGNDQNEKAMKIVLWMMPVICNMAMGAMYAASLGVEFDISRIIFIPMGILFMVIGNFMPKFRRNTTMGIKTKWALADDENWYATHRFAGKVWVMGGAAVLFLSFLPLKWGIPTLFIAIFALAFAPVIYSWRFAVKQKTEGKEVKPCQTPLGKWGWIFPAILIPVLAVVLFAGSITFDLGEDAMTVDATFWTPITLEYGDIESLELRQGNAPGHRDWGYGSARLLLGGFSSEELGTYTRYTYASSDSYILITAGRNTLVLADKDPSATQALYEAIQSKIG